jgi:macrolide transport system ATP-binding/permease protein
MRGNSWMQAYVRPKTGISVEQAQAEATAVMDQLEREFPSDEGRRVFIVPSWRAQFGAPQVLAPILGVLSVVVALVLLIACANVANLLLSRAVGRRREIAVRLSLGANRSRLVRQLLTEALLLALAAGVVGVALAYSTYGVLMAFAPPTDLPIDFGLGIDAGTLAYALAISIATGLVFGLAPAWQMSRPDTVHALKEEAGRGASGGRAGARLRNTLVVAQVAVCLVLLVGATLFIRSLQAAQHIKPGFDPDGLLIASIDLFPNGYTPDTGRQFHRRLNEALTAVPGVQSFALGRYVPLGLAGSSSTTVSVVGYTPQANEIVNVMYNLVGPRYFETMRIPLASGREFSAQDTRESENVIIVNETMAKRYWAGREALGGTVRMGKEDYRVVAVAKDIKYFQIAEEPLPYMYLPLEQSYASMAVLHVRSTGAPGPLLTSVRNVVRSLDPNLPIFDARTVQEHLKTAVFAQRMGANLLGAMGVLAILLAAIGLYGVIAYAVSQRTQEMGIRLALGAAPRDLLRMVLRHGLVLTVSGLLIGLSLSLVVSGFMRSLLPGIAPRDPITFIAVPLVLIAVATIAALIPARRAGAVDPVVALRYE